MRAHPHYLTHPQASCQIQNEPRNAKQRNSLGARGTFPALSTRRGRGACWGSKIRLGVGTIILFHAPASKTNHKLVRTHSTPFWVLGLATSNLDSLDSPRPRLKGSHHLPPYSILCSSARRLHPNGSFSRDSQGEVPKLSRFGLLGLWTSITSRSELRLGQGLNQSCSSPWELSNAMSHSCCKSREEVDSRILVIGSQIASLTLDLSFAHNLGCRCSNGSCKAILDIYTSRPFQWYEEHLNARCFEMRGVLTPELELWVFGSPGGLQVPTLGSVGFTLTLIPKWGCDTITYLHVFIFPQKLYVFLVKSLSLGETSTSETS
jgi:hypothetical protein